MPLILCSAYDNKLIISSILSFNLCFPCTHDLEPFCGKQVQTTSKYLPYFFACFFTCCTRYLFSLAQVFLWSLHWHVQRDLLLTYCSPGFYSLVIASPTWVCYSALPNSQTPPTYTEILTPGHTCEATEVKGTNDIMDNRTCPLLNQTITSGAQLFLAPVSYDFKPVQGFN